MLGPPHIRFYAGQSLRGPRGHALGTLCIIDRVPRKLSPGEIERLRDLACWAEGQLCNLELNRAVGELRVS